jgi:hypothetical protein
MDTLSSYEHSYNSRAGQRCAVFMSLAPVTVSGRGRKRGSIKIGSSEWMDE